MSQDDGPADSGIATSDSGADNDDDDSDTDGASSTSAAEVSTTSDTTSADAGGTTMAGTTSTTSETSAGTGDDGDDGIPFPRLDLAPAPDIALDETGDCGGAIFASEPIPPNILIVLDRSLSMDETPLDDDDVGPSKWEIALDALGEVTTTFSEEIQFGLMMFPGECGNTPAASCTAGVIFIDPGPDTAAMITMSAEDSGPCGYSTPLEETLSGLHGYEGLQDPERPNFVLLLTDGRPERCTPDGLDTAVTELRNQPQEVKTFVVGFGDGVDPVGLAAMAEAGGTARDTDPVYYQADNAAALQDAFAEIAGSIVSCDFALEEVPPDPDDLYAFFDAELVERDPTHTDGWDFDEENNQVTFYGASCEALKTHAVDAVDIVFGCPILPEK